MLELALYVVIFEFLDRFFSKNLKKKLALEETSKKRILIRQKVRRNRIVLLTCFVIFLIGTEIFNIYNAITQPYDKYTVNSCFWFPAVCLIYFSFQKKWKRIKGNISTSDLESFNYIRAKYALFLRGFDNDDYNKIDALENPKVEKYEHLSEYWFFKLLSKRHKLPVVSVGMTKELDSPLGTKRIYLDDNEWKVGVRTLMENADKILILVNDRDSCIWEIAQSKDFLHKTIFIVDNEEKYIAAKEKLKDLISLPSLQLSTNKCAIVSFSPKEETVYFEDSRMGYAEVLGVKYTTTKTKRKRAIWGCLVPLAAILVFVLILVAVDIINSKKEDSIPEEEMGLIDSVYISPFDKVRTVINQVELPMDIGSGLTMVSIDILEDMESIRYIVDVNEEMIDVDLLKQYAKQNMLEAVKTGDIHSQELQFWLYCMNNGINLEYHYQSSSDANNRFAFTLTVDDLKNAFQCNSGYVSSE